MRLVPSRGSLSRRFRPHLSLLVSLFLIASALVVITASIPGSSQARTIHMPIVIDGNGDFLPSNGVRGGSGVEDDPFIISDWNIQVSSGVGIAVTNTTAFFIIVDVQVNGTAYQPSDTYAVYIHNSANWIIRNCVFNNTRMGLVLDYCTDASISHSQFFAISTYGIRNTRALQVNIVACDFQVANPIYGEVWTNSVVLGNRMQNAEVAINVIQCINVTVEGNLVVSSEYGVWMTACFSISVLSNEFSNCTYGVAISYTDFAYVRGNAIFDSRGFGVTVYYQSYFILMDNNYIARSLFGAVTLDDSHDIHINDNLIQDNTGIAGSYAGGITITSCYNIWIDRNDFENNLPVQGMDDGSNFWNNTYPLGGNWWSDYFGDDNFSGPDQDISGPDGFGDSPYVIDPDSQDYYPWMDMLMLDRPPVGNLTGDPLLGDLTTVFSFSGNLSYDPDPGDTLQYRWDFDGDGNWDTALSTDPNATHIYPAGANYTVIMEVVDSSGISDIEILVIEVSGGVIPEFTGLLAPVLGTLALVAVLGSRRKE
jgi:parallel beta-helix repeat protein